MTVYDYFNDPSIKTRHANTARVSIAGQTVGEIAGLSVRESGGTDGSYVVGDAKPVEHMHNRWTCSGSISRFVWKETAGSSLNDWNLSGKSILNLPTFEISALDEQDGSVLFTLTGVTLSDRDMALQANQRIMQNLSFLALNLVEGGGSSGSIAMVNPGYSDRPPDTNLA